MKDRIIVGFTASVTALAGAVSLFLWLDVPPAADISRRVPLKHPGEGIVARAVDIRGFFSSFDGVPSEIRGRWPGFRGAGSRNVWTGSKLADTWPEDGPAVLWSVDLGEGYAGPAVSEGRVYVLDYDDKEEGDALRCFSMDDGREIWRRWYRNRLKRNHGMSRTVPAVGNGYVVSVGPGCQVMCVDASTGDFGWGIDLPVEYGTKVPMWYAGQCPLIDDGIAVIAPGGASLMIGVDCRSGEVQWETPNPDGWQMSHSSVITMVFGGRKMYVYCAIGGMVGVAADGDDRGSVLWSTDQWDHAVVAPSPIHIGNGRIFVTAGYGVGSMMIQLIKEGDVFSVDVVYKLDRKVFACEQHTPVLYRGQLYTVMPNDAGALKRQLVCMNPDGKLLWTSGKEHRFGLGPFMVAGDRILIMSDDGVLTMARAGGSEYVQMASAKVLKGRESWAPMAIVDGRLLARDFRRMVCLDLR